ncbi:metallo-beta-lactamase domain protein [Peptoniphilus sp. ING2-D1G]|nr:metallo-beta-lactamase domain protein [Peptoniphilus sp. ING2-D1G]
MEQKGGLSMKLIYFFDHYIKPHFLRGTKCIHPENTGWISAELGCIRQWDVNIWLYSKNGTTIAFDSGHLNYSGIDREFAEISLDPDRVKAVFLTHADVDHAGGVDPSGRIIFPKASVYLGEKEEVYVTGKQHRFYRLGLKIKNCVRLQKGYQLLKDGEKQNIDGISVEVIHIPGHTLGHCCYLVDEKILITGDCLALNKEGGYGFFEFFNQDSTLNKKSLHKLKSFAEERRVEMICTGHNGYTKNIREAFNHIDEVAICSRRKAFDESAPYDVFKE